MTHILSFFDINNTFFTVLDYPMSYLEFFGTLFNLWCVWLVSRNNIWTWPIGNIGVVLFAVLFYQIHLYSDLFEQVYYFITGFYGWWAWYQLRKRNKDKKKEAPVEHNSKKSNYIYAAIILMGSLVMGYVVGHIHLYLPQFFPEAATFAYLDAFTTVLSFAATILMARKKIECWYLWIIVDVIGIGLYYTKGVVFISLLYGIFLILATKGLVSWIKLYKKQELQKQGKQAGGSGQLKTANP